MSEHLQPSSRAAEEAVKRPNGWVYEIDGTFGSDEDVPPRSIVGAWKVNEKGEIEGPFIPNPNYNPRKE